MENIKSYSFEEVIQKIQTGEEYRGYEYKIIKNNKTRIEKYDNSEVVFDDLICDKFIKFKLIHEETIERINKEIEILLKEKHILEKEIIQNLTENVEDNLMRIELKKDTIKELKKQIKRISSIY